MLEVQHGTAVLEVMAGFTSVPAPYSSRPPHNPVAGSTVFTRSNAPPSADLIDL